MIYFLMHARKIKCQSRSLVFPFIFIGKNISRQQKQTVKPFYYFPIKYFCLLEDEQSSQDMPPTSLHTQRIRTRKWDTNRKLAFTFCPQVLSKGLFNQEVARDVKAMLRLISLIILIKAVQSCSLHPHHPSYISTQTTSTFVPLQSVLTVLAKHNYSNNVEQLHNL